MMLNKGPYTAKRLDNGEYTQGWLMRSSYTNRAYIIILVDDVGAWENTPRLCYTEVDPDTIEKGC